MLVSYLTLAMVFFAAFAMPVVYRAERKPPNEKPLWGIAFVLIAIAAPCGLVAALMA